MLNGQPQKRLKVDETDLVLLLQEQKRGHQWMTYHVRIWKKKRPNTSIDFDGNENIR